MSLLASKRVTGWNTKLLQQVIWKIMTLNGQELRLLTCRDLYNPNMTTLFNNGTYLYEQHNLNLQTGHLGDEFFIPANLSPGDSFYDARAGNVTILSSQEKTYVGAKRTVLTGTVAASNDRNHYV